MQLSVVGWGCSDDLQLFGLAGSGIFHEGKLRDTRPRMLWDGDRS